MNWIQQLVHSNIKRNLGAQFTKLASDVFVPIEADLAGAVDHIFRGLMTHQLVQLVQRSTETFFTSLSAQITPKWIDQARAFTVRPQHYNYASIQIS